VLREASRVFSQRHNGVNAFNIVGLSLEKTVGQRVNQCLPICWLTKSSIADSHAGGLHNQIALLLEIGERGDDTRTWLVK
jgi:hypothetical protein